MPSEEELAAIAAWRGSAGNELMQNNYVDTSEGLGLPRDLSPLDIKSHWPIVAHDTGKISGAPNVFWALEREIDARCEILFDKSVPLLDMVKAKCMGEMRGLAIAYSMMTGRTVEDSSFAAMQRYRERHAQDSQPTN